MSLTGAQINTIYLNTLGRPAASAEQAAWVALDSSGTLTDSQVIAGIVNSAEAEGTAWEVVRFYQGAFNRIPDQAGFNANVKAIDTFAGGTLSIVQLANDYVGSQEFMNHFGNLVNQTTATAPQTMAIFIQALYLNVLGRAGAQSEVNAWLATGDAAAQVMVGFTDSPEFQAKANNAVAALLTLNANDQIATTPTTALTGVGPLINPGIQVFNLTQGIDTFTATTAGATFNALPFVTPFGLPNNTLNAGDNLQDPVGDGTLNFTDQTITAFSANPAFAVGVTINGIKTLNFTDTNGFGGFQGTVNGLQTVNSNASIGGLEVGFVGQGIDATGPVVTTVNVNGFAAGPGFLIYNEWLAAANSVATNAIAITLSGALGGTLAAGADVIAISNDGAAGTTGAPNLAYGSQKYTVNSAANLQLQSEIFVGGLAAGTNVDGTTAFVFSGGGALAVGQDFAGNHTKVTSIDASAETATVWITGSAADNPAAQPNNAQSTGAAGVGANPFGKFGSGAGFLDDTAVPGAAFALTSFKEGTGTTNLDASSASLAQMAALTTTANTGNTQTNNMIIVNSTVADTTIGATFANVGGFQVLGVGGAAAANGATGTIDMSQLPKSINDILLETAQFGALAIINAPSGTTVDLEDQSGAGGAVTVGTVGPPTGLSDSLTWIVGDAGTKTGNILAGPLSSFGYENITITANGGTDSTGLVAIAPNPLASVNATINGSQTITLGVGGGGAIEALGVGGTPAGGPLLTTGLFTLTINDTGATKVVGLLGDATPATPLNFATGGGPLAAAAPAIGYSNNAQTILDSGAAGLVMNAGDANFTAAATVAASTGDTITGSTTASNVLIGSIGNDKLTGNTSTSPTAPDTIVTNGGADAITLGAGHTAADHVDVYVGNNGAGALIAPGADATSVANAITGTALGFGNVAQVGWWGTPTAPAGGILPLAANTSADQATVANFAPGTKAIPQDQVVFSVKAWDATGASFDAGLVNGALTTITAAQLGSSVALANAGGTVATASNTLTATTTLVIENTTTFGNAAAVAAAVTTSASGFFYAVAAPATLNYHLLVAYQDLSSNTHIMDLNLAITAGATNTFGGGTTALGSDMVQLTGVPLSALLAEPNITAVLGNNFVHVVA